MLKDQKRFSYTIACGCRASNKYEEKSCYSDKRGRNQEPKILKTYSGFCIEAAAFPMSILSWNCQCASKETVRYLRALGRKRFLDFIFLMETKQKFEYIAGLKKQLGYDQIITVEPEGLSGVLP